MALRFLADHCVSGFIIEALREQGHAVERLREHLPTDASDPAVIAKAQELEAILLSLNGDFADIVSYPPSAYKGIIALQIKNHPEITQQVVMRLKNYLAVHMEAENYVGKLFLAEAHRIRIRR
jgi:predicted nuclease of predicted toxin-antitoxin system